MVTRNNPRDNKGANAARRKDDSKKDGGKKGGGKDDANKKPGKQPAADNWLDCFAECVNSLGWEWAPLCAFLCDIDFPAGATEYGFPQPVRPQAGGGLPVVPPDGMSPFKGCRGFYENLTDKPQTITVTIFNPGPGSMDIDFQRPDDVIDGGPVTHVEEGETKTITVTVPPNRRLHSFSDGRRKLEGLK
jgi:hypothetical protein